MREIKFCIGVKNEAGEVSEVILTIDELLDKGLKCEGCEILYKRQFAGIKDVNGVDIYEGDIVTGGVKGNVSPQVIEWSESSRWVGGGDGYRSNMIGFVVDEYYLTIDAGKVIGNVHQNPELLK